MRCQKFQMMNTQNFLQSSLTNADQAEERLTAITEELKKEERNHENVARFTAIIEKYFGIKELNKTVPNKKIGQIEVHAAEKIYGKHVQKVDVYYRFIGNLN